LIPTDKEQSSGCVPVSTLLDPIRNERVCPHWSDRWELRTRTLGCGCSTLTILAILITIAATIAALSLLFGLYKILAWINSFWGTGAVGGYYIELTDDTNRSEGAWIRPRRWLPGWLKRRDAVD